MSDTSPAFRVNPPPPADGVTVRRFREAEPDAVRRLNADFDLGMDEQSFLWLQGYFQKHLHRDPTVGEVRVLAALARSEHGRGEFEAVGELNTDSPSVAAAWADLMEKHLALHDGLGHRLYEGSHPLPPLAYGDILSVPARYLRRTGADCTAPETVILSSPHLEWEAVAAGYRCIARSESETIYERGPHPWTEPAAHTGDCLLFCSRVAIADAAVLMESERRQNARSAPVIRTVGHRSLLLTLTELCTGADLYVDRLTPGKHDLPLARLCGHRSVPLNGADLLLRTPASRAFYLIEALKRRGYAPILLGEVRGDETLNLHLYADMVRRAPVVSLPMSLCRNVIGVHLFTHHLAASDTPDISVPSPLASKPRVQVFPALGMVTATAEVTATQRGQGMAAAEILVADLRAALDAEKETPSAPLCMTATLLAADGNKAPGDLAVELMCGLYKVATAEGIRLIEPTLTMDRTAFDDPAARLTLTLWRRKPPKGGRPLPTVYPAKPPKEEPAPEKPVPESPVADQPTKGDSPMHSLFEALKDHPRAVILDTDIGPDCDDVGAIVTLIDYAGQYGFPIAGICNCTSNRAGTGTIDAVCRRCGVDTPPLGQWSHPGFMDDPACHKYNDAVAETFSPAYRDGTLSVEDEVVFYRRLLATADDDGVMIISIGMFNDLAALLESPADEYSPLSGAELVRRKVHCLVSMAAILPKGRECNVVSDYKSAAQVFANWPTDIFLSDFHIGVNVHTGYAHITDPAEVEASPLALAYHLYTKDWTHVPVGNNASYDLTAVQFAVLGEGDYYGLGEPGRLDFYAEIPDLPDATVFVPDAEGRCRFMEKRVADDVIAASLNEILHRY